MGKNFPSIESEILEALKTYQWKRNATMLHFAMHINHSDTYTARQLKKLILAGKVERVQDGIVRGRPVYTYRLAEKSND